MKQWNFLLLNSRKLTNFSLGFSLECSIIIGNVMESLNLSCLYPVSFFILVLLIASSRTWSLSHYFSQGSSDGFYDVSPLDHLYQVLNYHPKYITVFLDTHNFLLRGIGPIPYDQRCYIGIMVSHCLKEYIWVTNEGNFVLLQGRKKQLILMIDHLKLKSYI